MLSDQPQLSCVTSMVLLCRWQQQSLEDMTTLGTDFETHAILQRYVEEPAAKDFIVRKACTIALSKVRGAWQSTLFMSLEIPWGFLTWAILRSLAGLMSHKKVSVWGFMSKKGIYCIFSMDFCTRNLRWQAESRKITCSESTTRFSWAYCFEKSTRSVPEIWGRMYDILPWSAKGTRKWDKKLDSRAAKEGVKKLVSYNLTKILE